MVRCKKGNAACFQPVPYIQCITGVCLDSSAPSKLNLHKSAQSCRPETQDLDLSQI